MQETLLMNCKLHFNHHSHFLVVDGLCICFYRASYA